MTDTETVAPTAFHAAQSRKPVLIRWLIAGMAALAILALALTGLAEDRDETAATTPPAESADAGFARDMAVHRQQAVEMTYIVRDRTTDEDVRRLAYDIAQTQANQRGMLLGWLDLWSLPKTSPSYMS